MMNYYQAKNYNTSSKAVFKTLNVCIMKCYSVATLHILFFMAIFYCTRCSKEATLKSESVNLLNSWVVKYLEWSGILFSTVLATKLILSGIYFPNFTNFCI